MSGSEAPLERLALSNGQSKPCHYCGEPCSALAADPGLWPLAFCHRDEPGVVKWHHTHCVTRRLVENQMTDLDKLRAALQTIDEGLDWFFAAAGAVSSHEMAEMIRRTKKKIDAVAGVVWPETVEK